MDFEPHTGMTSAGLTPADGHNGWSVARRAFSLTTWFHRSTTGELSPFTSLPQTSAGIDEMQLAGVRRIAWERKKFPSGRLIPMIA
jgi:hypothetical protein